jgi:hypothetical protein
LKKIQAACIYIEKLKVKQKVALCSIRQLSQNDHEESKIGSNEGAAIAEIICSKTNFDRFATLDEQNSRKFKPPAFI